MKELIRKLRKVIVITETTSRTSYKCLMRFIKKVSRLCTSVTRKIQILTVRLFRQREVLYLISLTKSFTRSFSLQQKNFRRVVTDIFTYTICRQDVIQWTAVFLMCKAFCRAALKWGIFGITNRKLLTLHLML